MGTCDGVAGRGHPHGQRGQNGWMPGLGGWWAERSCKCAGLNTSSCPIMYDMHQLPQHRALQCSPAVCGTRLDNAGAAVGC
jgi:hypothetical protein